MVAFCIIIPWALLQGVMIYVSKRGTPKTFLRYNLWCTVLRSKKYVVLFSPDFKYKVDSFNLYIIDNYVKRTTGRRIPRIETPKPFIRFIDRIISSFL